jgi:hypothetical protein
MKKLKPLEIKEDAGLKARRRARAAVGMVKPARVMTPKSLKPARHKRKPGEDEES